MPTKQPLKKKPITKFDVGSFKKSLLGSASKTADKELEWVMLPDAFKNAVKLPGIPLGRTSLVRGWPDTGKSTIKNCLIAGCQRQHILPVIFETEGNFDFQYAKDCGMEITPVYDDVEVVDPDTGEVHMERQIVDWDGDYILFTNKKMCEFCGDMDYATATRKSTKRKVAVIEDIAFIINTLLDKQDEGEITMPIMFIWDSIGSIQSFRSYSSKVGNNMFDANAINTAFKPIYSRIASSKESGSPYTNGLFVVNKIWQDSQNSAGNAVAVKNAGGESMQYGARLGIHVGGIARAGTKKLKATFKGEEYQYGNITKISIFKNQMPIPFNITYSGTICCVHNGIIGEDEIEEYKRKYMQHFMKVLKEKAEENGKSIGEIRMEDITFTESGEVE